MKKIVITDYGLGNLYSIAQACIHCGYKPNVSRNKNDILEADYLILPGMGAFGIAMGYLKNHDLINTIKAYAASGRPLMGVCLGMQLLFDKSEEFGDNEGLHLIRGKVIRFPNRVGESVLKIPRIGWSPIQPTDINWKNTPLQDVNPKNNHMYFVHSYYVALENEENSLCKSVYNGFSYSSGVYNNNIWGFQFHPEKSGEEGISIYKNFFNI